LIIGVLLFITESFIANEKIIYFYQHDLLGDKIYYVYGENKLIKPGKASSDNIFIKKSNKVKKPQLIIKKPATKIDFWFIVIKPCNYKIFTIPHGKFFV